MAFDPTELMGPRERLAYNINMRTRAADGSAAPPPSAHATPSGKNFFGEDGLEFSDLLDILNPLQHLPIISMAYRSVTGDEISAGARVIGGGLYGGVAGAFLGAVEAAVADTSGGKDLGAMAFDAVSGSETKMASSGEHSEASIQAMNDIAPAAGGGEAEPVEPAWVYSDAPTRAPAPAQSAIDSEASGVEDDATPAMAPTPMPPAPQANANPMPELSAEQMALLLSSVGLGPKTDSTPPSEGTPPVAPQAAAVQPVVPQQMSAQLRETPRFGLGPMKQHYVRPPVTVEQPPYVPRAQPMKTTVSQATVPATTDDDAFISEAMASALDKYRRGKVMEQTGEVRGSRVNGAF